MEKGKLVAGLLLISLLSFGVGPLRVSAQVCDPEALVPVSYGQRGSAVRNAQACLMELGYDIPAGATGYYGSQTRAAVQAFYADWYGPWHGNSLGPRGVGEMKSRLLAEAPQPSQPSQPSGQLDLQAIIAAVLAALQQSGVIPQPGQQPTAGEEGFLSAEKDPSVGVVTVREGETGRVAGIRFRADNGAVTVKSMFLRWTGSAAPHRVISNLALKDSAGNVLYQTAVNNTTFLQDSSLNYYLPISGLNVNVPRNGYASVFVEVTVVGTLPSGVSSAGFQVNQNDIRGVDGAGVDRFAPSSSSGLSWSFNLQAALAGSAYFIGALNPNNPREGYVVASDVNNKNIYGAKVMTFDLTAKNDNLRLTQITGYVTGTASVTAVSLRQGNTVLDQQTPGTGGTFTFNVTPSNFVLNRDQTVSFDVLLDLANAASTSVATVTVNISTTTGQNSLGDSVSKGVGLSSSLMRWVLVGPQFTLADKSIAVTKDSGNNTTTITSAVFKVKVKALNGSVVVRATNVATITLETASGSTTTANVGVTEVRDAGGNVISQSPSGYYTVPEGSEYTFEFRTSGQTFPGVQSVRARFSSLSWDTDTSSYPLDVATFLDQNPDYRTNFVTPQ